MCPHGGRALHLVPSLRVTAGRWCGDSAVWYDTIGQSQSGERADGWPVYARDLKRMAEQQQFSPVSPSKPPLPVPLTEQQRAIREELRRTHPRLAAMYDGALRVLHTFDHQEKLPLAAHLLRELIEKLTEDKIEEKLGEGIRRPNIARVCEAWRNVPNTDGTGHGFKHISEQLHRFIRAWKVYFADRENFGPKRKDQWGKFVDTLPKPDSAPRTQREFHVELWNTCYDFFTSVSHHRTEPNVTEFTRMLEILERFLSNWFVGGAFRQYDYIDRLIKQGEADGE